MKGISANPCYYNNILHQIQVIRSHKRAESGHKCLPSKIMVLVPHSSMPQKLLLHLPVMLQSVRHLHNSLCLQQGVHL